MSPEQFLQFANLLPEAMLLVTGEGTILAANRSAGKRLAVSPRDLSGKSLSDFVAEPPPALSDYLRACSRTREAVPGSLTLTPSNGSPVACRAEGAVVLPRSGDNPALLFLRLIPKAESPTQFAILTERIHALNREVAQRKRVEQELREQREWLRVTLSSIGDGVIATDDRGNIRFMNPVAQALTGWSQDDALGKPLEQVFCILNYHTRQRVENPVTRVLREGRVVGLANDTVLISRNGSEWPIADSGAPIRDERGTILGVVMVFMEMTERQEMEAELRERAQELAEANQRKDRYIRMLAHELRNPLGALSNAVTVLEAAPPGSEVYRRAQGVARRQLEHQARMVNDLLDVSLINQGTFELKRETVNLAEICRYTVEDLRHLMDEVGLTLTTMLPEEPLWVDGDPDRLSQVLTNLLTNSAKFTPAGGRVRVQLERHEGASQAVLRVSDTGHGISPELLPHIFEAFTQGDQELDRSKGGLGLGLTLVKELVELHGGTVRAESAGIDQGAMFEVTLPLTPAPPVSHREPWQQPMREGSLRVLVIDDIPDATETLADLLTIWEHAVETALSGPEGIAAARRFRPDVVICDLGLPGMDGYEVARQLCGDPETAGALLVALTGYGDEDARRRSSEAGFAVHLTKPLEVQKLQELLARHSSRDQ